MGNWFASDPQPKTDFYVGYGVTARRAWDSLYAVLRVYFPDLPFRMVPHPLSMRPGEGGPSEQVGYIAGFPTAEPVTLTKRNGVFAARLETRLHLKPAVQGGGKDLRDALWGFLLARRFAYGTSFFGWLALGALNAQQQYDWWLVKGGSNEPDLRLTTGSRNGGTVVHFRDHSPHPSTEQHSGYERLIENSMTPFLTCDFQEEVKEAIKAHRRSQALTHEDVHVPTPYKGNFLVDLINEQNV